MAADARRTIIDAIELLLARREDGAAEVLPESRFAEDLDMDSLEMAELSVMLEDEFGRDPFSEGFLPNTVQELLAFYA